MGDSMRRYYATLFAAVGLAILLAGASLSPALAAPGSVVIPGRSGGTWGKAIVIPGLGRLNTGGSVDISAVSCAAPGDCEAAGYYTVSDSNQQAFVVSQRNGIWNRAIDVPGLGSLNLGNSSVGKMAEVDSLSCAAPGDCSAGGQYTARNGLLEAFVVTERNGRWGRAIEVPGSARLAVTGFGDISAMSCPRPGDCTAGGEYGVAGPSEGASHALVVTERNGRWGRAIEVPGSARLDVLGQGNVESVSCAAPGDCSAGGVYLDGNDNYQAFVVTERHGRWDKAIEVPGSARLNVSGIAEIASVSCTGVGDCSAGGYYGDSASGQQAFVVTQSRGRWGRAIEVPGSARLNVGGDAQIESVSCIRVGDCSAGGYYAGRGSGSVQQAFVVTEHRGRWGRAIEVPGSARLNVGGDAEVDTVSCAAPGDCSAGGDYGSSANSQQAFVVTQRRGLWGRAIEVPGSAALNVGGTAEVESVSCAAPGHCSAGGYFSYGTAGLDSQGFVVTEG
jgi:hypothetical protein